MGAKKQRIKKYAKPLATLVDGDASEWRFWQEEAKAVIEVADEEIREAVDVYKEALVKALDNGDRAIGKCLQAEETSAQHQRTIEGLRHLLKGKNSTINALQQRVRQAYEEVDRLIRVTHDVATGDGFTTQVGGALIVKCDDRGQTDLHRRIEALEENYAELQKRHAHQKDTILRFQSLTGMATPYETKAAFEYSVQHTSWQRARYAMLFDTVEDAKKCVSEYTYPQEWRVIRRPKGTSEAWERVE